MEDYIVIEYPVCGGEIGTLDEIVLIPLPDHVAETLRVHVLYEHAFPHNSLHDVWYPQSQRLCKHSFV